MTNTFKKAALVLLGLLALTGVEAKEKITFYEYDALGNIVAATDEQGEILLSGASSIRVWAMTQPQHKLPTLQNN